MVKISVIVPVYNSSKYLDKCIDSLVNQTIKSYEIIIINDGSTDNSLDIINKYKKNNSMIKVISTKNNGIGTARNIGLNNSSGKYVAFVDSDDYVACDFLEKVYKKAISSKADVVVCNMYRVINKEVIKSKEIKFNDGTIKDSKTQLINIPLGPCGKLFLKENLTVPFAEKLKYEDVPFVVNALLNSKNTVKLDNYLYYYVIHDKSETTSMDKRVFDILEILKMVNFNLNKRTYLKHETEYLNILLLSRYNLQQKNQEEKHLRIKFLNDSFEFLNDNFPKWKNNIYFKKEPFIKRIIKTNKLLIKLYWLISNWKIIKVWYNKIRV